MARRERKGGEGGAGTPSGAPRGPRRPAAPAAAGASSRPLAGGARPSPSLVPRSKESTLDYPDLRLRYDDIGRGFLYEPMLGGYFKAPDPCTGPRRTDKLTRRAVRQVKGAAIKAHTLGRSLRTFVTFTVRQEERAAFEAGELVLGREIKRTLNALNEWLRRRNLVSPAYIWVAENVRDENPHIHLLTSYQVPRSEFDGFAEHLESLWGHGFAKIERVRKPAEAGRYMMKALAYTMKGADDEQGIVIGNRYGISREILPKYRDLDAFDCPEAADSLRVLQNNMTGDIEEVAPGMWLTSYGLSFEAGTELVRVGEVIDLLGRAGEVSNLCESQSEGLL